MSEELGLQERGRDRRAVDDDEGRAFARPELVDRARHQLLARASLAVHEHAGGDGGKHADAPCHLPHHLAREHHAGELGRGFRHGARCIGSVEQQDGSANAELTAARDDRIAHPHVAGERPVRAAEIAHGDPVRPDGKLEVVSAHGVVRENDVVVGRRSDARDVPGLGLHELAGVASARDGDRQAMDLL